MCHDDRAGKRIWSEVNRLLVDLNIRALFFLDYSHTLSVHTLAKPSLEFEKPGTQGIQGFSGVFRRGTQGIQGIQATHFGGFSEELRRHLPSENDTDEIDLSVCDKLCDKLLSLIHI